MITEPLKYIEIYLHPIISKEHKQELLAELFNEEYAQLTHKPDGRPLFDLTKESQCPSK